MGVLMLQLLLITAAVSYEVIYSFNCGSQTSVKTPLLHFDSDQMYEGLSSKSHQKSSLPPKYKESEDLELFNHERTTDEDVFSYFLPLKGPDHYYLLMKFIEVVHERPKERVFEVRLGDEVMLEIDIVKEVGVGEVLNKWIHFELVDDILYVNNSMPVLNGYIYPKQTIQMSLSKVLGMPKIETLTLLKGADSEKFIREHIELERSRLNKREESTAEKYQKQVPLTYRQMTGDQNFQLPDNNPTFYLTKLLSLDTLFSVVAVAFVVLHEQIYDKLNIPREEVKED